MTEGKHRSWPEQTNQMPMQACRPISDALGVFPQIHLPVFWKLHKIATWASQVHIPLHLLGNAAHCTNAPSRFLYRLTVYCNAPLYRRICEFAIAAAVLPKAGWGRRTAGRQLFAAAAILTRDEYADQLVEPRRCQRCHMRALWVSYATSNGGRRRHCEHI